MYTISIRAISQKVSRIPIFLYLFITLITCQSCGGGGGGTSSATQASTPNTVQDNSIMEIYPWEPVNQTKILPTTFPLPATAGRSLSIQASRGQFEPASFIIRSGNNALSGIQISASDLIGTGQQTIPANAVDIRLVKCWYQSGEGTIANQNKTVLLPELLLHDDALIRVDTVKQMNYLKVSLNGTEQYADISSPDAVFPDNAIIKDANTLQPFDLDAHTNKQVWVTVHIPDNTPSGDYTGSIQITAPGENTVTLSLKVIVVPFDLPQPAMEYSMYYTGKLSGTLQKVVNANWKTQEQYLAEMVDMKSHGIMSPTLYQGLDTSLNQALDIRKQTGIMGDSLYVLGTVTGNSTDSVRLSTLYNTVTKWLALAVQYGYTNTYIYGIDEAKGDILLSERAAWETVHSAGAKVFVACYQEAVDAVGDILDLAVLNHFFDPTIVDKWHAQGKKAFITNYPYGGMETPLIYRKNYGLALWLGGYDGAMAYTYQYAPGNIWNDFDRGPNNRVYRGIVFAYPTSNGVIDTIQWEGFRQGVDDVRYLTALLNKQDKATVKQWLSGQLTNNSDLGSVRKAIINKIING